MFREPREGSVFFVFLAILASTIACGNDRAASSQGGTDTSASASAAAASFEDITVGQLRAMMSEEDLFLVNVHIPFQGNIPDTDTSIRFDEIADHLDQLPRDREAKVVLYCRSGRMSEEAATTLIGLGYTRVFNLVGGMRAWAAEGYAIIGGPGLSRPPHR